MILEINDKFYDTKNYEVYCFCPIFDINNKYILYEKSIEKTKESEYFLVGGFDLKKRQGLIKLYKVIYNKDYKKIKIEYILDVDIEKNINNKDKKTFKGFKGPVNCISQSKKGEILISCYDKNVYLLSRPIIENIMKI